VQASVTPGRDAKLKKGPVVRKREQRGLTVADATAQTGIIKLRATTFAA
jgi:hypothetical protein